MPLIDREIADRIVPPALAILRIVLGQRGVRSAGGSLAVDVARRCATAYRRRQRHAVGRPPRRRHVQPFVFPLDVVGVLDDVDIEGLAEIVGHLAGGGVDAGRVEVLELAVDGVDADQRPGAKPLGHAAGELVDARRAKVGRDAAVDAGQLGADVRAVGAAVGVEPVEQGAQRILGADQRSRRSGRG